MLNSKALLVLDMADEIALQGRALMANKCWGCGVDIGDASGTPKHRRTGGREVFVRVARYRARLRSRGSVCHGCAIDIRAQYL